jgi:hypothetical protein
MTTPRHPGCTGPRVQPPDRDRLDLLHQPATRTRWDRDVHNLVQLGDGPGAVIAQYRAVTDSLRGSLPETTAMLEIAEGDLIEFAVIFREHR